MLLPGDQVKYTRLTRTLKDKGKLIPIEEIYDNVNDHELDWYRSIFFYNDKHYKDFKDKKTVRGIFDLKTNFLIWDFDSKGEIDKAKKDTIELVTRLINNGIAQDEFNVCFSGNKGFSVELETTTELTTDQFKKITSSLADGLATRDTKIVNPSRVFRLPFTKHPDSGLYKIPLTINELCELTSDQIKDLAKTNDRFDMWSSNLADIPESMIPSAEETSIEESKSDVQVIKSVEELDFSKKPKNMPSCKYAIMHGFFDPGNRSNSLIALAAHFKNQGFPKDVAFYALKGASELQAARTGQSVFNEDEIKANIIGQVYSNYWQGGTYSCKDHEFLKETCDKLGEHSCDNKRKDKEDSVIGLDKLTNKFISFAKDIEKNRIYTGVEELDSKLILTLGMSTGLLGAPGSGKSSMAFNILNSTSMKGIKSVFFSLDMGWHLAYGKLLSRQTGINFKEMIELCKKEDDRLKDWNSKLIEDFKNVAWTFKSGVSVDNIREMIQREEEKGGEKIKLVVIDYLECLIGPYADATANGAYQAAKLKDLATDLEICVITLVQPPKSAGDASKPLTSMRQIKGASTLEQNFRAIISVHREGFSPNHPEEDKFLTLNCLKNTMGGLFSIDLGWEGVTGTLRKLSQNEKAELDMIRNRNSDEESDKGRW